MLPFTRNLFLFPSNLFPDFIFYEVFQKLTDVPADWSDKKCVSTPDVTMGGVAVCRFCPVPSRRSPLRRQSGISRRARGRATGPTTARGRPDGARKQRLFEFRPCSIATDGHNPASPLRRGAAPANHWAAPARKPAAGSASIRFQGFVETFCRGSETFYRGNRPTDATSFFA